MDLYDILLQRQVDNGGEGGITPTGTKSITENGTYDVTNFASAAVNISPIIQSLSISENGTYSVPSGVDGYNPITVNVSGSGGGKISPFFHKQCDIPNTTSTTPVDIEEVQFPDELMDDEHILYFVSRYVGTVPNNHYIGAEIAGIHAVYYSTHSFAFGGTIIKMDGNGQVAYSSGSTVGLFPMMGSGKLYLRYCYSPNITYAIGGTYDVKIYMIPKSILLS